MSENPSQKLYSQLYDFLDIKEGLPKFQEKGFSKGVLTFKASEFPDRLWQLWMQYEKNLIKYKHNYTGQVLKTKIGELAAIINSAMIQSKAWEHHVKETSSALEVWEKSHQEMKRKFPGSATYTARSTFYFGQKEITLNCYNACLAVIEKAEALKQQFQLKIELGQKPTKATTRKSNIPKTFEELFSDKTDIEKINKVLKELKAVDSKGAFILKKNEFVGFVDACVDKDALKLLPNYPITPLCRLFALHYKITISNGTIGEAKSSQPFYDFKAAFTKAYK